MAASSSCEPPAAGRRLLYALVALMALSELAVLLLGLAPDAHPVYRAYFIDKTTTCLERQVSGSYRLGQRISFRPDGRKEAQDIKRCGWSGPAGNGTHSIGTSSGFKIRVPPNSGELSLTLEMNAGRIAPQRVIVSANGMKIGQMTAESSVEPATETFAIPAAVTAGRDTLDLTLAYPDAFLPAPRASEINSRAIRLLAFRLASAGGG